METGNSASVLEGLILFGTVLSNLNRIGVGSALTGWILAAVGYNPVAEPTQAVINAVKFDYTWMGVILGIIILVIVLLLDVENMQINITEIRK